MIILVSSANDYETTNVLKWLNFNGKQNKLIDSFSNLVSEISYEGVTAIWFRKIKLDYEAFLQYNLNYTNNTILLLREFQDIIPFYDKLSVKHIGKAAHFKSNKLQILNLAEKNGLNIPKTFIVNNKKALLNLFTQHERLIIKQASDFTSIMNKSQNAYFLPYSKVFLPKDLKLVPDNFFSSLVQVYIEPLAEVKTLFFDGEFYSVAIISTNDSKKKYEDLKLLMKENKNFEIVPYDLDYNIKLKMRKVFKELNLNFGVFDGIIDLNNNFSFLEINPGGKFAIIESTLKIGLYKKIAEYLC